MSDTQRVLICGATGFIGRNVAERLAADPRYEVVGIHHQRPPFKCPGLDWRQADLTDAAAVNAVVKGFDILIQAAATTSGAADIVNKPYLHVTDNAVMNSLLFRAAHDHGVGHVVFFSCTVMYPSRDRPLKETDFSTEDGIHPRYFGAAWTKLYMEKMCEFYACVGDTKYTVVRHSNIYGPHDKFDLEKSHVCAATITKVLSATEPHVVVWGNGEEARDLLYVDDLVDFVALALARQSAQHDLFNVGLGSAISVKNLVEAVIAASGRGLTIRFDTDKPSIDTRIALDCDHAKATLGWAPETSLEDGLAKTIQWWRENVGA